MKCLIPAVQTERISKQEQKARKQSATHKSRQYSFLPSLPAEPRVWCVGPFGEHREPCDEKMGFGEAAVGMSERNMTNKAGTYAVDRPYLLQILLDWFW